MDFNSSLKREKGSRCSLLEDIYGLPFFSPDLSPGLECLRGQEKAKGRLQLSARGSSGPLIFQSVHTRLKICPEF